MTKSELIKALFDVPDNAQLEVNIITKNHTLPRKIANCYYCEATGKVIMEVLKSNKDDKDLKQ